MSNEKPIKLDMSFKEALQMIAKGGKQIPSIVKTKTPAGEKLKVHQKK